MCISTWLKSRSDCYLILFSEQYPVSIEVTGMSKECIGTYELLNEEKATLASNGPAWKLQGKDFYIFNNDGGVRNCGWRIGDKDGLKSGDFIFKSEINNNIFI